MPILANHTLWVFIWLIVTAMAVVPASRAALRITEILAENDGGLRDADGESPDWIELVNDSPAPVNLDGWVLTDAPEVPTKWSFPPTNLAAGAHLVVFASGKNRTAAGMELHTNFRLESTGGYLALMRPGGAGVEHALAYPAQRRNVSFGITRQSTSTQVLAPGASARVYVPSNNLLGLGWTGLIFDDSAWFATNTPVGFVEETLATTVLSIDFNERGIDATPLTEPGFVSFVINSNLSGLTVQTQATTRLFGSISVTVSNTVPFGYDDFLRATPGTNGAFTETLLLRDFIYSREVTGTGGLDVTLEGLTPGQRYRLTIWSFDSSSVGSRTSDWYANGMLATNNYVFNGLILPTSNEQYRFSFDAVADGSGRTLISGRRDAASVGGGGAADRGVFLNALRVAEVTALPVTTGLAGLMTGKNASAYVRVPFTVSDPGTISLVGLRIRYDDGFVAYLNGQEVAARNAHSPPEWNATAMAEHSSASLEEIAIDPMPGLLVNGQNMLAVHGLNLSASDGDFHVGPELIVVRSTETAGRFYSPPSPGVTNGAGFDGLVADTKFSVNRGFYDAPFSLSITCATAGAQIRYTTNGSPPTATSGYVYAAPVMIDRNSFIRAAAFLAGHVPSDIDTHSYIFLRDVVRQSNNIPNYPTIWQASYPADYAMDSNIVNHPVYGGTLSNDLRSIPSLCIVSDHTGLWSSGSGIYPNSTSTGTNWERAASLELIDGSGATEFAATCKLEMHGNASRDNVRTPKHSMHVVFNGDYGPTKLRYDWFGGGVDAHDKIVLRSCGFVDGWAGRYADNSLYTSTETGEQFRGLRYRPENTCYLRDVWVKDSFRDMGWSSSRSQYVHLYINGLYWGLYEPSEAPNASYFAALHGGPEGAWDVLVGEDNNGPPVIVDGSGVGWTNVLNLVNAGITTEAAYAAITNLVDIDNLIDYMMVHIVAESEDWPRHNWYVARRRATNGLPATRFISTVWDQELTLDRLVRRNRVEVGGTSGELYSPARVYQQLRAWPEFRRQFGDRVHKHLFNNGALTPSNNIARLLGPAAIIRDALVGESARWGDARKTGVPAGQIGTGVTFTRDEWWQPEIDKLVTNFFQKITADNVVRLRAGNLYPALAAPFFNQFGGGVPAGFSLTLGHTNANGLIYFTMDGSDPRVYGSGAVAPGAQTYGAAVVLNSPALVRARVFNGGQWSALVEAFFFPPQDLSRLALSEIMFHPPAVGTNDGDEYEFIELKNTGTNALNLTGLRFSEGIEFVFTNGTTIAPGQFLVLVANAAAFSAKYPGVTFHGIYSGRLANGGESLRLSHPLGATIFFVAYDDRAPWPAAADDQGFSIVPASPGASQAPDNGASWRASAVPGGSPGAEDPQPVIPAIVINELLTHPFVNSPTGDRIELYNPTAASVDIGGWFLTDDATTPKKFRIPDGTTITSQGYVVFNEADFNPTPGTNSSFGLSSLGDDVYLFSGNANTNLTGYSHGVEFGASERGASFGRHLNSAGDEQFPAQIQNTFATANSNPRVDNIVINEVHYNPAPGSDEFVELHNTADTWFALYDGGNPSNTWRVDGIDFTFPTNITIPARGYVLLVATNPTAFRTEYDVPAEVQILGPFAGSLQDSGERLSLMKPGEPTNSMVPYIVVDSARYNDRAPWPAAADGAGASLQRVNAMAYGDEPLNWAALAPTPGTPNGTGDADGDGLPDDWENANGTQAAVADAFDDLDVDGLSNLEEFIAGTHPLIPQSSLRVEALSSDGGNVTLRFNVVSNRSYGVLFKAALDAPLWSKVANVSEQPTNGAASVTHLNPGGIAGFYRIVTPQLP